MSSQGPDADRAFIQRSVRRGIIGAVVAAVGLALLWVLKSALTPLAVAFVLAYLVDPLIDRFEAIAKREDITQLGMHSGYAKLDQRLTDWRDKWLAQIARPAAEKK